MRIAAYLSHPIQYFTPLWQEVASRPGVELKVFYFSRHGLEHTLDPGFGVEFAWDIDLLAGHDHAFLPRPWPGADPNDYTTRAVNAGLLSSLNEGWDLAFVAGYAHLNNWALRALAGRAGLPMLCHGDTTLMETAARPLWKRAAKQLSLRWFFRRVDAFVCAGGHTADYFQSFGVDASRTFISPYVVDVARWQGARAAADEASLAALRQARGIPEGKRLLIFCGKLVPWKRPGDLLDAVKRLGRDDVHAVFVGEGELRGELQRAGGELATVTGFVNQRELPLIISMGDVLVLPSESEPYGLVAAEAHAMGLPAVVSDRCGCWGEQSAVLPGETGYVYPCGDIDALAQALGRLLDDEALYARMSRAATQRAEMHSPSSAADGFLAAARFALARNAS